jgi:replication fork protection complex subunit Csm3/Swi3
MSSPAPLPTGRTSAGGDEFDDLFDYDVGGEDDPFSDNYKVPSKKPAVSETASKGKNVAGLGIDEEVEITRKPRPPQVKLDEDRYVSVFLSKGLLC